MKVLHVNLAKSFRGGERQTELLIRALSAKHHQQGILLRRGSPLQTRLSDVPQLSVIPVGKPFIATRVRPARFELCHAHETRAAQWAAFNNRLTGLPYLITRRVPKVPHRDPFTRAVYRGAGTTVCLSREIRANLLYSAPRAQTQIIPDMCANLEVNNTLLAQLRERYRGKYVIGNVGALIRKHKGQHVLIEAMRRLRDIKDLHCLILGEGYDGASLMQAAAGLDSVEFLGFRDDVGTYLALFDLFVYPSLEEGLGSTLLDAMQAGCPIIATGVGGIPEVVAHGCNGLLVPPNDAQALAEAIRRVNSDRGLGMSLAENGARRVLDFEPAVLADRYLSVYQNLLAARGGAV